jgi:hypothetical protein
MAATVSPETFTMVLFDQPTIVAEVERIAALVGVPAAEDVSVVVDEAVPVARARLASIDPLVLEVEGGAFEDPRHPRQLSQAAVADTVGRLLIQALDRRNPDFGDVPDDDDIPLPHRVAWDVYAVGRLSRLGLEGQRQRRLYSFRNRHGFTDVADEAFARLWDGVDLTWPQITALSDDALAARPESAV